MNRIFSAALLLSTIGAGVALAQTTAPQSTAPQTTAPQITTIQTAAPAPTTTAPVAITPAVAATSSTMPSAVATGGANTTAAARVAGANSFTMAQAQQRLEDHGYTEVSALAKDANSIWRGQAMKDGKTMDVALDYQGNITAN